MQRVNLPDDKPGAVRSSGRMAVFVRDGCVACGQLVQRLQSSGTEFDLYMVGSRQDDARIRAWAKRAQIDPARVRRGRQLGRASWRERGCQYVWISVVAGTIKKK